MFDRNFGLDDVDVFSTLQTNAAPLFYVAEKYNIDMATHLEDILQKRLKTCNALFCLSISFKFDLKNLKASASSLLQKHFMTEVVEEQMKVSSMLVSCYCYHQRSIHGGFSRRQRIEMIQENIL